MIAELFLCAAMALPPTQASVADITMADVKVIQLLLKFSKGNIYKLPEKRVILLVGGWTALINPLKILTDNVWRLTMSNMHENDVIGSAFNQPFKADSASMVIFQMVTPTNHWGVMQILKNTIYAIAHGGYILFDPENAPEFPEYLDRYGFEKLPIRWHKNLIYIRKVKPGVLIYEPGMRSIRTNG